MEPNVPERKQLSTIKMKSFYSSDIVVWNKIIATYGSVKPLIIEGDEVRLANYNEKQKFKEIRK